MVLIKNYIRKNYSAYIKYTIVCNLYSVIINLLKLYFLIVKYIYYFVCKKLIIIKKCVGIINFLSGR
jgi:hypothetical protein